MTIQLSDHFTYKKLLKYTFPTIAMMVFMSIYIVIDGLFISNFVGKDQFVAINLIMPFLMCVATVGTMFGAGGGALVSKILGEGDNKRANEIFSMTIYISVLTGIIIMIFGQIFMKSAVIKMGATGLLVKYCLSYGRIFLAFIPAYTLQFVFQSMFTVAEKPQYGFIITVLAGVTNIVLDAIFIVALEGGIIGAVLATVTSQVVGGVIPIIYFVKKNDSLLKIVKPTFKRADILKICTNGSSEMVTNISISVVSILYNFQLLKYMGENGVAIYGLIMYVNFIFNGIYMGYAIGVSPIIGYQNGANNFFEVKNVLRKSIILISFSGVIMTIIARIFSTPLAEVYFGYDAQLKAMSIHAFELYAFSFLITGFNIFGSAFFTSLNEGLSSATISFLRTFLFQVLFVLTLPPIFGVDGLWISITIAELMALIVTAFLLFIKQKNFKDFVK